MTKTEVRHPLEAELVEFTGAVRDKRITAADWVRILCRKALNKPEADLARLSDEAYAFCDAVLDCGEGKDPSADVAKHLDEAVLERLRDGVVPWFDGTDPEDMKPVPAALPERVEVVDSPSKGRKPRGAVEQPKRVMVRSTLDDDKLLSRHEVFRELVMQHWRRPRHELLEMGAKAGIEMPKTSMSTVQYHVRRTLDLLRDKFGIDFPDELNPPGGRRPGQIARASKEVSDRAAREARGEEPETPQDRRKRRAAPDPEPEDRGAPEEADLTDDGEVETASAPRQRAAKGGRKSRS